jgi:hypothetical protein
VPISSAKRFSCSPAFEAAGEIIIKIREKMNNIIFFVGLSFIKVYPPRKKHIISFYYFIDIRGIKQQFPIFIYYFLHLYYIIKT